MVQLYVSGADEAGVAVTFHRPQLLAQLLAERGLAVESPCGGLGTCGKCLVRAWGKLAPPTQEEQAQLTPHQLAGGIRLACQTQVLGDAWVVLPGGTAEMDIQEGIGSLPSALPLPGEVGIAVDVGTTTLAAALYRLSTGQRLAVQGMSNPQRRFGADVISRIRCAMQGDGPALAAAVRDGISHLVNGLLSEAGVPGADAMVITGNTAMLRLLCGEEVSDLAAAPFLSKERFGQCRTAGSLSLAGLAPDCPVWLPHCISAFVGADVSTAILACGLAQSHQPALLADVGTNGELALWTGERLICCSTAAGPAFEGAGISMGGPASPGAIYQVQAVDGTLHLQVLGDGPARHLCGSGLLDGAAALLELEILEESGYLNHEVCRQHGLDVPGQPNKVALTPEVSLTQGDIRALQMAKAAIRAGIDALLAYSGRRAEDIPVLFLAGGFGSHLSPKSAAEIGMIPPVLADRAVPAGNAALSGAAMLLLDRSKWDACAQLAGTAYTLPLATDPKFRDAYIERMIFSGE